MRITDNQEQAFNSFTPKWKRKKRNIHKRLKEARRHPYANTPLRKLALQRLDFRDGINLRWNMNNFRVILDNDKVLWKYYGMVGQGKITKEDYKTLFLGHCIEYYGINFNRYYGMYFNMYLTSRKGVKKNGNTEQISVPDKAE